MTITIAGKTLEWPEGCEYFQFIDSRPALVLPYGSSDMIVEVRERQSWLPFIASAVAQHFRNLMSKHRQECLILEKTTPFDQAAWVETNKDFLTAFKHSDAWAELAKV